MDTNWWQGFNSKGKTRLLVIIKAFNGKNRRADLVITEKLGELEIISFWGKKINFKRYWRKGGEEEERVNWEVHKQKYERGKYCKSKFLKMVQWSQEQPLLK